MSLRYFSNSLKTEWSILYLRQWKGVTHAQTYLLNNERTRSVIEWFISASLYLYQFFIPLSDTRFLLPTFSICFGVFSRWGGVVHFFKSANLPLFMAVSNISRKLKHHQPQRRNLLFNKLTTLVSSSQPY